MKNLFAFLLLALAALPLAGCASEPADEPAAPPPSSEPAAGKFQAGVEGSGAGAASPFRQSR